MLGHVPNSQEGRESCYDYGDAGSWSYGVVMKYDARVFHRSEWLRACQR